MNEIIKVPRAELAQRIASTNSISELKEIERIASVVREKSKREARECDLRDCHVMAAAAENTFHHSGAVVVYAQRRMGELISDGQEKGTIAKPGRQDQMLDHQTFTLDDLGISRFLSHRYQVMARVPMKEVDKIIDGARDFSIGKIYKRGLEIIREEERERFERDGKSAKRSGSGYILFNRKIQDIASNEIQDGSVDVIITDPPYLVRGDSGELNYVSEYKALSRLAGRVLKPGGSLLVMVGQAYLFQVMRLLGDSMMYRWTLAFHTPGGYTTSVWARKVISYWKPILWFIKKSDSEDFITKWKSDFISAELNASWRNKRYHDWGQDEGGFMAIIDAYTKKKDVICDPFMGGGTTGMAALRLGRKFIGNDCEEKSVNIAAQRIHEEFDE